MLVKLLLEDAPNRLPAHKRAIFQHSFTVVRHRLPPISAHLSSFTPRCGLRPCSIGLAAVRLYFFNTWGGPPQVSELFLDRSRSLCTLGCLFPISHMSHPEIRSTHTYIVHVRRYVLCTRPVLSPLRYEAYDT